MNGNVMKRLMLWFLLAVLFLPAAPSWAADGDIDTTFGTNGKVTTNMGGEYDTARALGIQSDGKIIAAGDAAGDFALVRYNPNGSLDTSFGTGGKVTTLRGTAYALGIQSDGKIVAAGQMVINTYISAYFALVRYNSDGSLDTTFGTGGKVTTDFGSYGSAHALAIHSDGKIVIAGESTISGGDFTVIRYNPDGSLDTTFGTDGVASVDNGGNDDYAAAIAIQNDGRIVIAGSSAGDFAIVRYNTDGSLDGGIITPVGSYVDKAYAVGIQSDGKIVATGYRDTGGLDEFALVRYNTDGSLDSTFGTNGIVTTEDVNASAWAMGIQSDGKIVAAGRTYISSGYDFALIRYNTNGSLDTTFGTGGIVSTPIGSYTEYALALSIQSDGKIVAAGTSLNGPSNFDFAVVRYLTGAATPTPTPKPSSTPSSEKGSISGDVIDTDGYPIESAKIKLKGKQTRVSKRTTSDEDGAFEFTDLSADTYTITATRKGYKKGKQVVPLGKGEDDDIEIEMKKKVLK